MKFKNITDNDMTLRGVEFPAGKGVSVECPSLAEKLRNMPEFEQVKRGPKAKTDDQDAN